MGHKIQILPPDEASPLLLDASAILLFAGFPELAYQGFIQLTQGKLKVSEESSLVHPIKQIIPALCYFMKIPCPPIFSEQETSNSELEKYMNNKVQEYELVLGLDRWGGVPMPSGDWSEDFLHELTHPKVDIKGDSRYKVYSFFQDLHRVLSQYYVNRKKWQEAIRWLQIFEDILDAWEIETLTYLTQEILVFGICTYLHLEDMDNADRFIKKWWQSQEYLIAGLSLVVYFPDVMSRISEGILRNQFNISLEQAQDFLELVNRRNYIPISIGFIPTVNDWQNFLAKWNEAIFNNLKEEYMDYYGHLY